LPFRFGDDDAVTFLRQMGTARMELETTLFRERGSDADPGELEKL